MSKALATKNVAAVLLGLGLVLGFAFAFAKPAKADTLSDLQAQVQALLAQIAALQGSGSATTGSSGACFTFTQNESLGMTGGQVMWIQEFLNAHGAQVSATGAGSPGNETSYFGAKTKTAVAKWQAANGVSPASGYWGPLTRAKANSICAGSSTGTGTGTGTGTTTPTGPGITVSAAAQPANSLAPQNASRVPFTTFTLTNNTSAAVTINGVTVQRTGLAQDAAFSGVILVDPNGIQLGTSQTFNANHQATVGGTFTLNPGQSMTLTVAGNMAASEASYAGEVASISVVGVNTTVPVSGTLPISGAQQTINATLTIGTVSTSTSSFDPGTNTTHNIGDTAVRLSGVRFTADSAEDLKLYSVRWRQVGTASAADINNVVTVVNGTSYPTTVDSSGRYYTATFPGGILIPKGNSIDVYVQADLTGTNSASRTVEMDIDKVTDVYFVGQLYGYGVAPSGTYTPWYKGNVATINAGSASTIQSSTSVPAQNIATNIQSTPLGGFQTTFLGEPVTENSMTFYFNYGSTAATGNLLTSVSLVDSNGHTVAGPVDAVNVGGTSQKVTFTDTVTFPVGAMVYTLKGKVPTGVANGETLIASTTPSSDWAAGTGQTSGNSIPMPSGKVTMSTMTVRGATTTITVASTPISQTIVSGGTNVVLSQIQLDASQSGEDVRLASLPLELTGTASTTGATAFNSGTISGCQLFDTSASSSTSGLNANSPVNPTAVGKFTFTFMNPLTVSKGTVKTLAVECNIASGAQGTILWGVTAGDFSSGSVQGVQSGVSITPAVTTATGPTMTVASSGSLTATAASTAVAQPALSLQPAGTTGVTVGYVKFHATNEAINLQKVGLTLSHGTYGSLATGNGGSSNSGVGDVVTAYIYNGATLVGTAIFTGSNQTATSTLNTVIPVSANSDLNLTIKADLGQIGFSQPAGIGDTVKIDPLNVQGVGVSSGTQVNIAATSGVNGVQIFKSVPTVALASGACTGTGCNGSNQVLKAFTVTANASGNVSVEQLVFSVATSSATATSLSVQVLDQNGNVATSTFGTQLASLAASTATFTGGPVIIPAGTTYTFKLIGTVTPGASATNWSVNTTLKGDSAAISGIGSSPTYIATTTAVANGSNFVWSDNATTTAGLNDVDWTNGYQVNGLPSIGI